MGSWGCSREQSSVESPETGWLVSGRIVEGTPYQRKYSGYCLLRYAKDTSAVFYPPYRRGNLPETNPHYFNFNIKTSAIINSAKDSALFSQFQA